METVKVTIEVPKPPDGYEVIGPAIARKGDLRLFHGCWDHVYDEHFCGCVARKKQTLAEWMNAQPDFQVLARMMPRLCGHFYDGEWTDDYGWPKPPIDGRAKAVGGKWINQ